MYSAVVYDCYAVEICCLEARLVVVMIRVFKYYISGAIPFHVVIHVCTNCLSRLINM